MTRSVTDHGSGASPAIHGEVSETGNSCGEGAANSWRGGPGPRPGVTQLRVTEEDRRVAWLATAAVGLSLVDAAIPSPLPGVKPGLANIVTLAEYHYSTFLGFILTAFVITYEWQKKPAFLRGTLWIALINWIAYILMCYPGEYRSFYSSMPFLSILAAPGRYTVKLEVWGSSLQERGIVTRQITVTAAAQNQPPVADFSWSCTGTVCTLDASTSTDDVGIASYDWSLGKFPDGTATGVSVTTDYWHTSTRTVTLTVTDTNGQTNSVTQTLTIP